MKTLKTIKRGDRVSWAYEHHLNSRSSIMITKRGEYLGIVPRTYKHQYDEKLARVKFEGNKNYSKVPFSEIKRA
jgi:hypothetical protein